MHGNIEIAPQRILEDAIFDNPGEFRNAGLIGVEFEDGRSVAEDAHREHGHATLGRDCFPDAELAKECDVARRERVDAGIETIGEGCRGPFADQCEGKAPQRTRQACADRTRADDDELIAPRVYNRASIPVAN